MPYTDWETISKILVKWEEEKNNLQDPILHLRTVQNTTFEKILTFHPY